MRPKNSDVMGFGELAEKFPREGFGCPINSRQNAEVLVKKALAAFKRNLFAIQYAESMTRKGVPTTIVDGVQHYYDLILAGVDVDSMIKVQI